MITVEKITAEHIPQIYDIEKSSFSDPWSMEGFFSELDIPDRILLSATDEDMVCGYVIGSSDGITAWIDNIAVSDGFRRQGIGNMLLSAFCEKCADCESITLEVRESNIPAQELYKKYGFSAIGVRKNFYTDPRENAVVMSYQIRKE
ncbi:MAG: ribosomal protein S18-alanine N-acetyltransferase [Oscillospiraceae bacterium]|nr:ribosomal protein S18-alanine N-acetyltransferase [Oscillospiraceae bacterium]